MRIKILTKEIISVKEYSLKCQQISRYHPSNKRLSICRGIGSFLNPGGWQKCEGKNLPTLVRIGLTDLRSAKFRGGSGPPAPPLATPLI